MENGQNLRTRRPKSAKTGKEGSGKKLPLTITLEGAFSRKFPISLVEPCREMGFFSLKTPFSEAMVNGSFLTPRPSFPDFGEFDPSNGGRVRKAKHRK